MSNERLYTDWQILMEGDAILSVQTGKHREVPELRWDGATEIIRVKPPERATMT